MMNNLEAHFKSSLMGVYIDFAKGKLNQEEMDKKILNIYSQIYLDFLKN